MDSTQQDSLDRHGAWIRSRLSTVCCLLLDRVSAACELLLVTLMLVHIHHPVLLDGRAPLPLDVRWTLPPSSASSFGGRSFGLVGMIDLTTVASTSMVGSR